jgi:hypothetical protein
MADFTDDRKETEPFNALRLRNEVIVGLVPTIPIERSQIVKRNNPMNSVFDPES